MKPENEIYACRGVMWLMEVFSINSIPVRCLFAVLDYFFSDLFYDKNVVFPYYELLGSLAQGSDL